MNKKVILGIIVTEYHNLHAQEKYLHFLAENCIILLTLSRRKTCSQNVGLNSAVYNQEQVNVFTEPLLRSSRSRGHFWGHGGQILDFINLYWVLIQTFHYFEFRGYLTSATSATSEGAQGIFSKVTFMKSVHSNQKDEVCHSFLVEIFTKSLHRGGVKLGIYMKTLVSRLPGFRLKWL